ncbi:hypothetical protein [Paenibacillus kribbensis]|uniref:hypothetical protein n=1 Tax=Paenibacillus kribbensis TaxID=172713 RepID=UPI0008389863|nr:hypothetical protein [Paenibacillus kribbensis]
MSEGDKKTPISDIEKRINQLEERKKNLVRFHSEKERKKRANQLIQTGALAEKYFGIHHLSIEQREELFKIFSDFIAKNKPDKFKDKEE